MARIRKLEIHNYRAIKTFAWLPSAGINCLIGPGDSGKSSVLDAIDACLGARRTAQFTDADFYNLDVTADISITLTIGELDDALLNLDAYGMYLRSFDATTGVIEDEPEHAAETVLTLRLTVTSDLEPAWSLVSDRAIAQNLSRNLAWADRVRLAPTRIGAMADYNLSWRRGSVLNRLSDERPDASAALVSAARDARTTFGDEAERELGQTLAIVTKTAKELGVPIGEQAKAMLDTHSVSFSGGTISLHDEGGVPLRGLGMGSIRLLVAGLQRTAAEQSTIILIDELEHGLEPHRIIRLLGSLGAREQKPPLQAFVTTHSPVALRELSGSQLFVMRQRPGVHEAWNVGAGDDVQSTIRCDPDAFLAPSVMVCEGATEVGFLRGIDHYRTAKGGTSISAHGVALVDSVGKFSKRAKSFVSLGYRTALIRDSDVEVPEADERAFMAAGGKVFCWRDHRTIEDELFLSLPDRAVGALVERAIEIHTETRIDDHIKSASQGSLNLAAIQEELTRDGLSLDSRILLGKASRPRKNGWFKQVTWMEEAANDIVAPALASSEAGFKAIVDNVFEWSAGAGG
jgi:putative AbiEii toxin of type IV toxin-antitoxin system